MPSMTPAQREPAVSRGSVVMPGWEWGKREDDTDQNTGSQHGDNKRETYEDARA